MPKSLRPEPPVELDESNELEALVELSEPNGFDVPEAPVEPEAEAERDISFEVVEPIVVSAETDLSVE